MAVGHLLLQSFWANEAIFQLMKISEKYLYQEIYEKSLSLKYHPSRLNPLF